MISPVSAVVGVLLNAQLVASLPRIPLPKPAANVSRAMVHQNTVSAGVLTGTRLRVDLDVMESAWHPESANDPEVPILAFAERGRPPVVPGPLIRAPLGTTVTVSIRNTSDSALTVYGLRPGSKSENDTITLAAKSTREVQHTLGTAGTFLYYATFAGTGFFDRLWKDSQLTGAIVVDAPGKRMNEHVLVLTEWFLPYDENRPFEVVSLINGKGWPHTNTIELNQNDSTRFRVVNGIPLFHPLHLHGFYYRIESQAGEGKATNIPTSKQILSNTDLIEPGHSVTFSFLPSTPGNWLFHCHFAFHADETVTLAGSPRDSAAAVALAASHAGPHASANASPGSAEHMRGLVIGIKVKPKSNYVPASTANARELKLFVGSQPERLIGGATAYGFALQKGDAAPAKDSIVLPGPVLELKRGEPVRIVVQNNLKEPTSVHWHGLEIESFPDGVPHWSGMGSNVYSQIQPGESFTAAFTPPRSGTFPYHSHLNDRRQINGGMYGALIVTDKPRDLAHDHLIVVGGGGPEITAKNESPFALVNGRRTPRTLRLAVGEKHRIRIVTIHPDYRVTLTLQNDSTIARWRAVAKDGADIPLALRTMRHANTTMGPGQTADYEFTPTAVGTWTMNIRSTEVGWFIPLEIVVEPRKPK